MTAARTPPERGARGHGQRGTRCRGSRQHRGGGHPPGEGWGARGRGRLGSPSPSPKRPLTSLEGGLISVNRTENRMFGPRALLPTPPLSRLSYFEGLIFPALMKATAVQGWYLGLSVRILMVLLGVNSSRGQSWAASATEPGHGRAQTPQHHIRDWGWDGDPASMRF